MKKTLPKHVSYGPSRKVGPYIYFVKDGSRVTMPGRFPFDQSSAEFWAQYAKCLKGEATVNVSRRTIGELIKLYRASESFTNLCAGSTQKNTTTISTALTSALAPSWSSGLKSQMSSA